MFAEKAQEAQKLQLVAAQYAVAISPHIQVRLATSPALRAQFLPDVRELEISADEEADPIGDFAHTPLQGLVHRYSDRVLIKLTHTCPVYCRFCFRREMVGPEGHGNLSAAQLANIIEYLRAHSEVREVIFTGGDPLILSPRRIAGVLAQLAPLQHIETLRFHSRVPMVSPELITAPLIKAMQLAGKLTVLAVHSNHADEFSPEARASLARLKEAGVMLLSQSVLLRGVNDDVDVLEALMRAFVRAGVKPYYLHHPDLAKGTGHFRLSITEGRALMAGLKPRVSGHLLPRYMLDLPGGFGKVDLASAMVRQIGADLWEITDMRGQKHIYPPAHVSGVKQGAGQFPQ